MPGEFSYAELELLCFEHFKHRIQNKAYILFSHISFNNNKILGI